MYLTSSFEELLPISSPFVSETSFANGLHKPGADPAAPAALVYMWLSAAGISCCTGVFQAVERQVCLLPPSWAMGAT